MGVSDDEYCTMYILRFLYSEILVFNSFVFKSKKKLIVGRLYTVGRVFIFGRLYHVGLLYTVGRVFMVGRVFIVGLVFIEE